ncbi:hypothetical protein WJX84_010490 [Apatococcus fuscideae]|uniref:Uncharacterized protein n=1 Tax=Apatococcus fuscideae TaxID=2026836 RepID=A0AAW1T4D2_9CHLO
MPEEKESPAEPIEAEPALDPELQSFTTLSDVLDPLQQVERDLLIGILSKARGMGLDKGQTDAFTSIMRSTHLQVTSSSGSRDDCFASFKSALTSKCVHRPPYSIGLFSIPQAREISTWLLQTYLAHFNLYRISYRDRAQSPISNNQALEPGAESVDGAQNSTSTLEPSPGQEGSGVQDEVQQRIQLAVAAELVRVQGAMNAQTLALQTRLAELEARLA